jgi:hypothetical protein
MSLTHFHRFFICIAFACFIVIANWSLGHNEAQLKTPWIFYLSLTAMALLAPYFAWTFRKFK